jgi:uncharacterized protein YndB with AHSA1/START domain
MPSAERTIAIRRPIEQVFRFLSDGRTATQWRSSVVDVSRASGDGVGAVYRQVVRGPGGRPVDADYEITALEPNQRIAFRAIAGPVRPEGEFLLEAMGEATILTFRLASSLPWWRQLVLGRLVQSAMDAEMRALDALQELLER